MKNVYQIHMGRANYDLSDKSLFFQANLASDGAMACTMESERGHPATTDSVELTDEEHEILYRLLNMIHERVNAA